MFPASRLTYQEARLSIVRPYPIVLENFPFRLLMVLSKVSQWGAVWVHVVRGDGSGC
jgi:hypothetical protein